MINIKELSIGNYVLHLGAAKKVGEIISFTEIVLFQEKYYGLYSNRVSINEIEPVPLTPEILEKNGFEFHSFMSDYPADYVIAVGEYNIRVNHLDDENVWCFTIHSDNENIRIIHQFNILFVHQLQNALTLCGINKEIEL